VTAHVDRSIVVDVPVRATYDQWTRFSDFPRFMSGVEHVQRVSNTLTHWVVEIAGVRREWDAAILEDVPDEKIAWAATSGAANAGAVYFEAIGNTRTRVRLTLDFEPEGLVERLGDALDVAERQTVADLFRFKQLVESRGRPGAETAETGGATAESVGSELGGAATDDAPAGWSTGYPGPREPHTTTGAQNADDPAAGFVTGYPGDRTPRHAGEAIPRADAAEVDTRDDDGPDRRSDDSGLPPTR
jgi:hypothetical protein